jgi:hypothetical protein
MALPDVHVGIVIPLLEVLHFSSENVWKPGVVLVGHLDNDRVLAGGQHKPLICVIRLQFWIEGHPDLTPVLTNGGE